MTEGSAKIILDHIIQEINYIERFTSKLSKEAFFNNPEKQHAVMRAIEIIGEAVKNLPESFKKKYPLIRWKDIAGTRDVLIHAYFSVDLELVWDIVETYVPKLKKNVQKALEND